MSDPQQFDTKQVNAEAKAAFHELVKAIARHQARLDLVPPPPVNDNDTRRGTRGKA